MIYQKPRLGIQLNKKHSLAKGLVGCWLMNEGTGNKVFDLSGYGNHGTNSGADWTPKGLNFVSANSDYIELTDIDRASPFATITVGSWINLDVKTDFDTLIEKNDGLTVNSNMVFRLLLDNSADQKWRWKVWGADGVTAGNVNSDVAAATGEWVFFVGMYDGTEVSMFINGVKQSVTLSETGSLFSAANNMRLGMGNNQKFDGKMSSVYIWNRALSHLEVKRLYLNPYQMFQRQIDFALTYYETPSALSIITDGFGAFGSIANIILEGYHQGATTGNPMWYYQMLKRRN